MDQLFSPESIAIIGLSSSSNNIAKLILENLIRWGTRAASSACIPAPRKSTSTG